MRNGAEFSHVRHDQGNSAVIITDVQLVQVYSAGFSHSRHDQGNNAVIISDVQHVQMYSEVRHVQVIRRHPGDVFCEPKSGALP